MREAWEIALQLSLRNALDGLHGSHSSRPNHVPFDLIARNDLPARGALHLVGERFAFLAGRFQRRVTVGAERGLRARRNSRATDCATLAGCLESPVNQAFSAVKLTFTGRSERLCFAKQREKTAKDTILSLARLPISPPWLLGMIPTFEVPSVDSPPQAQNFRGDGLQVQRGQACAITPAPSGALHSQRRRAVTVGSTFRV